MYSGLGQSRTDEQSCLLRLLCCVTDFINGESSLRGAYHSAEVLELTEQMHSSPFPGPKKPETDALRERVLAEFDESVLEFFATGGQSVIVSSTRTKSIDPVMKVLIRLLLSFRSTMLTTVHKHKDIASEKSSAKQAST